MPRKQNKPRADGRLMSRIYLGDGKYKYVLARTQKELDKKVLDVKIALGKGIDVMAEADSFGEWAQKWLEIKEMEVCYKRYTAYKGNIQNLEPLAHHSLTKLRPVDFQSQFNKLYRQGLSVNTLKACKCAAKQVYDLAIANRVTDFNPITAVKLPRDTEQSDRRALTEDEISWIVAPTDHRGKTPAMLMLYAGLRRGEMIALKWQNIDLNEKTLRVTHTAEMSDGKMSIKKGAKTESSVRTVDLPDILVDYLRTVERRSEFVCPNAKGKMHTETSWKRLWDSYLAELNFRFGNFPQDYEKPRSRFAPEKIPFVIPRITPHWLRHTFITMMYQSGIDVLTAKEQAGHSDISTTLEIYTHLDKTYKRREMNKLNDYIAKAQPENP